MPTASRIGSHLKDAQRLWREICQEEGLVNKKRRWLMQLPSHDTIKVGSKKLKKPKYLSNAFLSESYVRSDDVSAQAVRLFVERSFQPSSHTESLHEVQNYMAFSDVRILQNYLLEPCNLRNFYSSLDLLSDKTLCLFANLVTEGKIKFDRTRRSMKEIIKSNFPNAISAANDKALAATLKQLTEVLQSHENSHEKQIKSIKPTCSNTLSSSIQKALESLDSMPIFVLNAVSRKLNRRKLELRFPPSSSGRNKKFFANKIRRKFQEFILSDAIFMPERLLKALSIIHLYFKYKKKFADPFIENLFSFSVKTISAQNDVLKALWSFPNVTSNQTKALQSIFGLKLGDKTSGFLNDIKQYLMQYLFECDEMDIPADISNALCIINQNGCNQSQIEAEIEAVLNLSIEFLLMVSPGIDDMAVDGMLSDDDDESNDFELTEKGFCVNLLNCRQQQRKDISLNDELNFTGDSMSETCSVSSNFKSFSDTLLSEPLKNYAKKPIEEKGDIHGFGHHCKVPMEASLSSIRSSKSCVDSSVKQLCDETSILSYRLIGHMLNDILQSEGHDVSDEIRHQLTGEAFHSRSFEGKEDMLKASCENIGINLLVNSIKDLLSSISKR